MHLHALRYVRNTCSHNGRHSLLRRREGGHVNLLLGMADLGVVCAHVHRVLQQGTLSLGADVVVNADARHWGLDLRGRVDRGALVVQLCYHVRDAGL